MGLVPVMKRPLVLSTICRHSEKRAVNQEGGPNQTQSLRTSLLDFSPFRAGMCGFCLFVWLGFFLLLLFINYPVLRSLIVASQMS